MIETVNQVWNTEILTRYQSKVSLKRKSVWHKGFARKSRKNSEQKFLFASKNFFFQGTVQGCVVRMDEHEKKNYVFFFLLKKKTKKILKMFPYSLRAVSVQPYGFRTSVRTRIEEQKIFYEFFFSGRKKIHTAIRTGQNAVFFTEIFLQFFVRKVKFFGFG